MRPTVSRLRCRHVGLPVYTRRPAEVEATLLRRHAAQAGDDTQRGHRQWALASPVRNCMPPLCSMRVAPSVSPRRTGRRAGDQYRRRARYRCRRCVVGQARRADGALLRGGPESGGSSFDYRPQTHGAVIWGKRPRPNCRWPAQSRFERQIVPIQLLTGPQRPDYAAASRYGYIESSAVKTSSRPRDGVWHARLYRRPRLSGTLPAMLGVLYAMHHAIAQWGCDAALPSQK